MIDAQVILVSDGSTDETVKLISNYKSPIEIKVIELSRNFGHQAAVWCGLNETRVDAYSIVMDADLQDPPDLILEITKQISLDKDV